ncbi:hypothetical protein KUTeg_014318 [Tegillarca granosa]|uniref:Uncharacterized protein n=1 Tax=Tegillarca granosa TaxID=220873 RepID=A0ABQ9EW84_TEGGR|nr:hypothetical protein KUTeg_014318 [Tegillarca granosa]
MKFRNYPICSTRSAFNILDLIFLSINIQVHTRLRYYSEGEDTASVHQSLSSPLPDIVPIHRDRSVSLPSVPSLQAQNEAEVGRELRRISDEFHLSYVPRRQRK